MRDNSENIIATDDVLLIIIDKNTNITEFNSYASKFSGYESEDAIGKNLLDICIPANDHARVMRIFDDIYNGRHLYLGYESSLLCKNGSTVYVRWHNTQIKDAAGQVAAILSIGIDITRETRALKEFKEQGRFLQSIIDGIDHPIMVINADYTVELMNKAVKNNVVPSLIADPQNPKWYEVSHHHLNPCDGEHHPCSIQEALNEQISTSLIHAHPDENGYNRYYEITTTPLWNKDGSLRGVIESSHDITVHIELLEELKIQKESLKYQAEHDVLTGLPNRFLFNDRLEQAIHKARRNQEHMALFFIDLDQFKLINDSLGHGTGDVVLKTVASRLQECIRAEDTIARLGGDEFTVIVEALKKPQNASMLAQKIIKELQEPIIIDNHELCITTSIGISIFPQDGDDSKTLLQNADAAMYDAKDEGRNTFQFYTKEMTEQALEQVLMETHLHHALMHDEFSLLFQPQINQSTKKIIGFEALLRWQHPTLGLLSPDRFIPLAEETGFIMPLGEWVLRSACTQIATWYGMRLNPGRITVNLSGSQVQNKALFSILKKTLDECNCKPEWLELEVSEWFLMKHPKNSITVLEELRDFGIKLAVDNFGTGYSSLTYLKRMPVEKLKIDRSFINNIPHNPDDTAITEAIIALAKSLGLRVMAEGVESRAQLEFLLEAGCEEMQGYYNSLPSDADVSTSFLMNWAKTHP